MTTQRTQNLDSATSQEGFSWRIFGPGILMATAAIGGSHSDFINTGRCHIWLAVGHYDYSGQRF